MRVELLKIKGFRCFDAAGVDVRVDEQLTVLIGPNGAGKSAILSALARVAGATRGHRTIVRRDFHAPGGLFDDTITHELSIELIISLPELADGTATPETIAPVFSQMLIDRPEAAPVCRMRLDAIWEPDGTVEGEITPTLSWVTTLDEPGEEDLRRVTGSERGLIQVLYVPASRDAESQLRSTTGALAARLIRGIEWSAGTENAIDTGSEAVNAAFRTEAGVDAITAAVGEQWAALCEEPARLTPGLNLATRNLAEMLGRMQVAFTGANDTDWPLPLLSEGQQSLFYFALLGAVRDLELRIGAGEQGGFDRDEMAIPQLTILAIEEPENHLSPFFLSRLVGQARQLASKGGTQVLFATHSAASMSRVEPAEVRYVRLDDAGPRSRVREIELPNDGTAQEKFIRGAIRAFPELYFARFVLLVEGDSERLVLPRLASAKGLDVDPSFVAVVPLGGRHVGEFWRLLNGLEIPFATLVDLDLGRTGGGFGRVKTTLQKLLEAGTGRQELLQQEDGTELSQTDLDAMHTWQGAEYVPALRWWVTKLEQYNVYFSAPLDLDFAMLRAFSAAYSGIITGTGPQNDPDAAANTVFGVGPGLEAYSETTRAAIRELLPAYRYHFLTNGKPSTHLAALTSIEPEALAAGVPYPFGALLEHVQAHARRD